MLTGAATDPVLYGCLFSSHGESQAKYNLTEPIPLQVEHVAVVFILDFRLSGPGVDTSYFTHNWETRGGRERLIPSRTGPKDLPTAINGH